MAIKEYDNESPVSMASETGVAYVSTASTPKTVGRKESMSVDAYFEKVKKALDKRYENL